MDNYALLSVMVGLAKTLAVLCTLGLAYFLVGFGGSVVPAIITGLDWDELENELKQEELSSVVSKSKSPVKYTLPTRTAKSVGKLTIALIGNSRTRKDAGVFLSSVAGIDALRFNPTTLKGENKKLPNIIEILPPVKNMGGLYTGALKGVFAT